MIMKRSRPSHLVCLLCLLPSLPALAGEPKPATASTGGDWEFSISVGPAYRNIGQVDIHGGYRSGGFALPSFVGSESLTTPSIGDANTVSDRQYNDGFVRQDAGTASDGSTWNWGYDNPGQVQGNQLVYQATGFRSIRGDVVNAPATGPSRNRDLEGISPHLQFDARSPQRLGLFRVGFSAALDFVKTDRSLHFSNFSARQTRDDYRLDYEDRYDLDGVIPPLAPYQGSFGGPGPVINNLPSSRGIVPVLIGSETADFSNAVFSSIDLNALNLAFGPTLSLEHGRFDFALSAGLTLNIYDWETRQDEALQVTTAAGTTEIADWSDRDHGVKLRPGAYLQGQLGYQFTERFGASAFARIDAAKSFHVGAGPTTYEIDPYGVTAGLMLRFTLP